MKLLNILMYLKPQVFLFVIDIDQCGYWSKTEWVFYLGLVYWLATNGSTLKAFKKNSYKQISNSFNY